jgi:hypothetical protein
MTARDSKKDKFFRRLKGDKHALKLVERVIHICNNFDVRHYYTATKGGDLRVTVEKSHKRSRVVIIMRWVPRKGHFNCGALLSIEKCVGFGIPREIMKTGTYMTKFSVNPGKNADALITIVAATINHNQPTT